MDRTVCLHDVPMPLAVSVLCRQSNLTTQRNFVFNVDPDYLPNTQNSPSCVASKGSTSQGDLRQLHKLVYGSRQLRPFEQQL